MITITMTLFPQGVGLVRQEIITGTIWTTDDGKHHAYRIDHNDTIHTGKLPKTRSGHRNPFHLLHSIASDILGLPAVLTED